MITLELDSSSVCQPPHSCPDLPRALPPVCLLAPSPPGTTVPWRLLCCCFSLVLFTPPTLPSGTGLSASLPSHSCLPRSL